MKIEMAKSLRGHDKDEIYVIYKKDESFVFLINGDNKTLNHMKKKKQKHIQVIKNLPQEVLECLSGKTEMTDELARKVTKIYLRSIQCQKQM